MKLAFLTDEACLSHEMGIGHPEAPARLLAINQHLTETGLLADFLVPATTLRDDKTIEALWAEVHSVELLESLIARSPQHGYAEIDADTRLNCHSLRAARTATAMVMQAVDGIVAGDFEAAFCSVRPPGHHAERSMAMGFCLVNQAAVTVNYLRRTCGARSFAILDFDVHHGNGTFDIFKDDESVLVCSSYQHPFYPGRQSDSVAPNLVHSRLDAGSNCDILLRLIERDWLPALERQRPEWVIISAGFDAHRDDPLGGLCWTSTDYYRLSRLLLDSVQPLCAGRVISLLEGGYNLKALAESVDAHLRAFVD